MSTKKKKPTPVLPSDVQALVESPHTMQALLEGYVAYMEGAGKASGTLFSYRTELEGAVAELGADTPVAIVTEDWVARYFECDRVLKSKLGRPKSKLTIDKSRRVLRLAFGWAVSQGWIPSAPIPEAYRVSAAPAA